MIALKYFIFTLILTTSVTGFQNGDRSEERLPGKPTFSLMKENTVDGIATNNIIKAVRDVIIENKKKGQNIELTTNGTGIKLAPIFKHPSHMQNIIMKPAGSFITLRCTSKGNPTPNITWYKNNGAISRRYFQPTYGKWSVSLEELTTTDKGNYTCLVCNELSCISHTYTLQVQERFYAKPVVITPPVNQTKLVGETVNFNCKFLSDMHPYIYWTYYNATTVPTDGNIGNDRREIVSGDINDGPGNLTIFKVTKENEGWYVCVAMNSLGTTSAQAYLTVSDPSPVTSAPNHERLLDKYTTVTTTLSCAQTLNNVTVGERWYVCVARIVLGSNSTIVSTILDRINNNQVQNMN